MTFKSKLITKSSIAGLRFTLFQTLSLHDVVFFSETLVNLLSIEFTQQSFFLNQTVEWDHEDNVSKMPSNVTIPRMPEPLKWLNTPPSITYQSVTCPRVLLYLRRRKESDTLLSRLAFISCSQERHPEDTNNICIFTLPGA